MADKFGIKEVMNVTFFDLTTKQPVLYLDTLKLSSLENTAEQAMARGGHGNPILLTWDYNREANFEVQDALMTPKSLSMLAGTELTTGATIVHKRDELIVDNSLDITLSETPVDGDYATDLFIYALDDDAGTPLTIDDITGKVVSLNYDGQVTIGDVVVAYYPYETGSTASLITITSDAFPGYYKIVGDTLVRSLATGQDEKFQLIVERAKVLPGFTITMEAEGDPSVFDMNLQAYRPADGTEMVKMIKY